jgi:hypothetical protein
MPAPYAAIYERDESGYINSQQSVNVFITSSAPCGPVGTRLVSNSKEFYKKYTPDSQYKSGYPVAFLNAQAIFDINAPIYFTRVLPEDALYGGAVVTVGNSKPSYSLPNGLASPDSFVFSEVTDNKTNEKVSILCKADNAGSLGGKYFYLPGQQEYVYLQNNARAEQATITCNADVTGSLTSTYFILPGQKYYAWLNVDSTGVDPGLSALVLSGMTGIEVAITANSQAAEVATAINTELAKHTDDFTATVAEAVITVTMKVAGVTSHGNAGTTGFMYTTSVLGVNASEPVVLPDLTGIGAIIQADATAAEVATAINNAMTNTANFESVVDNSNTALVIITAKEPGFMLDAIDGGNPTSFVITTMTQGSAQSGSEAMLFYTADPNAMNISFKIYSHQDNPTKAPDPYTFVVAVYRDNVLENEYICSRKQDLKDGLGNPLYVEQALEASSYLRCRDNVAVVDTEMPPSINTALKVTGGTPGTNVTTGDMIDAVKPLYNKDDFDITLLLAAGYTDPAYVMELNNLASTRGDCCVINSIPYYIENTADYLQNIVNYRKNQLNINSSYTATFTSNLQVYNSGLNRSVYIPSDGHIAGAIINASRNYEIYYPILGFKRGTLNNVLDVKHRYQKEEMDTLYDNQLNPIRYVPGRGIVIWGQKTMQTSSSSLDRLNARLLLCSIKPQLQEFLEDNIGELNTDVVRDKMVLLLGGLFDTIQAKQGILAHRESCDPLDSNDPNKLVVNVGLQITPAIEFAELTITLEPAGVTFS